jgi:hypothetical protein
MDVDKVHKLIVDTEGQQQQEENDVCSQFT